MRVDLNSIPPERPDSGQGVDAGSRGGSNPARVSPEPAPAGESFAHRARVSALAAKVAELPEVRTEKVASLQQAIAAGSYRVTAEQTAGAIVNAIEVSRSG